MNILASLESKSLSYLAAGMISYAFLMFYFGIGLEPADFWPTSHISPDMTEVEQNALRDRSRKL